MAMNDRDRSGPPGVRLPEPQAQPLQPKKAVLSRQSLFIAGAAGVLMLVLAAFFIVFALGAGRTPSQAVAGALDEGFTFQQELVQVSLAQVATPAAADADSAAPAVSSSGERSVYFFISNEQLACALLNRKAGGYEVQELAGHLPLTGDGKEGIWMATGSGGKEYLVFGLLYDAAKTRVEVEGSPAVVVDTGLYRLWYYMGSGSMAINSESVVYK